MPNYWVLWALGGRGCIKGDGSGLEVRGIFSGISFKGAREGAELGVGLAKGLGWKGLGYK